MCRNVVVESAQEYFSTEVGFFNISGCEVASIVFIFVNFHLPVNSSLELTNISLVSDLLQSGQEDILNIDDRFCYAISNLFRHFDPAV